MHQNLVGPLGIYCTAVHSTEMYVSLSPIRNGWGKFVLHRACWMHRRSLDNFYLLPFLFYCIELLMLVPYLLIMYYSCFMIVIYLNTVIMKWLLIINIRPPPYCYSAKSSSYVICCWEQGPILLYALYWSI